MNLSDIVRRRPVPVPWAEGAKIPWHDAGFSQRMLKEHLSQEHDAASRRTEIIDRHVRWIHEDLLASQPGQILDLACGPGLYTSRLARLGHVCTGIDFGPASIAHARQQAEAAGLACTYVLEDIRQADYGTGHHLAMLVFGEFNVFTRQDVEAILSKAWQALVPGGLLLLEPHTYDAVRSVGQAPACWYSAEAGLFAPQPHLCLMESFWDVDLGVATERYLIIDAETAQVTRYASSMQAYSDEEYRALLTGCGFAGLNMYPSLAGAEDGGQPELMVYTARRL